MFIKVEVDQEECSQCGVCYNDECPEMFEEDPDGLARVRDEYRIGEPGEGRVPPELKDCVQRAIDACPTSAIMMLEADEEAKDKVVGY